MVAKMWFLCLILVELIALFVQKMKEDQKLKCEKCPFLARASSVSRTDWDAVLI